jgi:hypothetical protein
VKSAVASISGSSMKSPKGTAKNRKPSGNIMARATPMPRTAGTLSTTSATKANCEAALTTTRSARNHTAAAPAIPSRAHPLGRGSSEASCSRRRQASHSEIGTTSTPWA